MIIVLMGVMGFLGGYVLCCVLEVGYSVCVLICKL